MTSVGAVTSFGVVVDISNFNGWSSCYFMSGSSKLFLNTSCDVTAQVLRLRTDLEREHERKMTEMREASRRMKEDYEHQFNLEK